ncbi:peptidase S58 family protein [Brevibacterium sp. 5221]|uniref:Peptidase S58 family protein n=1 Tax=Brevibacterium rongguiense TaxID=2695267 RepID=A0A6N9HAN6_9MICO|nr:P1 family peptidase [Brevibacterium rongguiense]MYM20791.1 peptidase S58 family protein [Brevibacterium rongguiense]
MPLPPQGRLARGAGLGAVPGVRLGLWGSVEALTGVAVVLPPPGTAAGVDVRGGGPASRETAILAPGTLEYGADAVVLTGGSAFGLAAAGGVQAGLAEQGIGCPSGAGLRVPIVPAAAIFDLGRADGAPHPPGEAEGRAALDDALEPAGGRQPVRGSAGPGLGAWTGRGVSRGGLGQAAVTTPAGHTVAALVVANPMGTVLGADGGLHAASALAGYGVELPRVDPRAVRELLTGAGAAPGAPAATAGGAAPPGAGRSSAPPATAGPLNTTIACLVTDAALTDAQATRLAASAHAGIARAVWPSHTLFDGDTVFALALGSQPLPAGPAAGEALALLNIAAADALSAAIVDAVLCADDGPEPGGSAGAGHREDRARREAEGADSPAAPRPPALASVFPELARAWRAVD